MHSGKGFLAAAFLILAGCLVAAPAAEAVQIHKGKSYGNAYKAARRPSGAPEPQALRLFGIAALSGGLYYLRHRKRVQNSSTAE